MGYKLKEMREKQGWTQDELAQKSGVSRGTISALENGTVRGTNTKTLVKLADALRTSIQEIFFGPNV